MKNRLLLSAFALLAIGMCNEAYAQTWDFTNFSEETLAGLQNDYNNGGCRSQTKETRYTLQCEQQTLTYNANGTDEPIKETEGLLFSGGGSGYLYFDYDGTKSRIKFNKTDLAVTIPGLTDGTVITIVTKTGNSSSERGIVCTTNNAVRIGGAEVSLEEITNVFVVTCSEGTTTDVTFQPQVGGINIYSIECAQSGSEALTNLTSFIQNPNAAAETGWTIDKGTGNTNTASGQHYSGDADARYFDSWNPTAGALNYNATQTVTDLPNGNYTLKFAGRNSGTKGAFVYVVTGSDTLWVEMKANAIASVDENGNPCISYVGDLGGKIWEDAAEGSAEKAVHDGNGYGWNWYETPEFEITDNTMTIGITTDSLVSGVPFDGNWFSAVDFELYGSVSVTVKDLLEVTREQVAKYVTWLEAEGHEDVGESLTKRCENNGTIDMNSTVAVSQELDRLNQLLNQYKRIVSGFDIKYDITVTIGDWYVSLDHDNCAARINQYTGKETDIVVPESFIFNGKEYITTVLGGHGGDTFTTWYYNSMQNNYHIKSVKLPATLRLLGVGSMKGLKGITNVTIPSLVHHIHYEAFYGCSSLTSLNIPRKVNTFGKYAFSRCENLRKIVIPSSSVLFLIDNGAFEYCSNLKEIELPEQVTTIGCCAFEACSSLESLVIPSKVTSIGESTFRWCRNLKEIELPEQLTTIDYGAFNSCSALDNVVIPAKVTTLGDAIFSECTNLVTLYSEATYPPSCGYLGAPNLQIIYVPIGSGASYRNTAPWSYYYIEEKAIKYNLTYVIDGTEYKKSEVEYGAAITTPETPAKEGHTFSGWSEIPETMPAHDVTVTGTFTVNKYEVVYTLEGEAFKKDSVLYGAAITAPEAPAKEGHTFAGWGEVPETMPANDLALNGTYTVNKYNVIYTVDGTEYKKTEVEYGAAIIAEAAPEKEGHTFSGWSEIPETMPAQDVTVTGTFTVNKYEIVYKVDGEVYHKDSIAYGETIVAIEIPVKEGYIFSGWSEIPETMPAEDVEVSGNFEADGIEKIFADKQKVDVYTLQGVKIKEQIEVERLEEELPEGIYIVDGQKVVVKK
ncbi:MAG: leucine-rich repeat protein [Bacteroidaceae bacterium]|nr:leucine-rich repeat protein [Bacteroidaceae bacterium]